MLAWLSLGCVAVAAGVLARWWLTRVDALGRHQGLPWVRLALVLACAAALAVPGLRRGAQEHRLSEAASQLVGSPVSVHCLSFGQTWVHAGSELGFVRWGADGVPEPRAVLSYEACAHLRDFAGLGGRTPDTDEIIAVHVLAHEAMHMAGRTVESEAECAAVQRDALTARLLGASDAISRLVAVRYWRDVYPRMTDDYRSPECRESGAMDEHAALAPWRLDVGGASALP